MRKLNLLLIISIFTVFVKTGLCDYTGAPHNHGREVQKVVTDCNFNIQIDSGSIYYEVVFTIAGIPAKNIRKLMDINKDNIISLKEEMDFKNSNLEKFSNLFKINKKYFENNENMEILFLNEPLKAIIDAPLLILLRSKIDFNEKGIKKSFKKLKLDFNKLTLSNMSFIFGCKGVFKSDSSHDIINTNSGYIINNRKLIDGMFFHMKSLKKLEIEIVKIKSSN